MCVITVRVFKNSRACVVFYGRVLFIEALYATFSDESMPSLKRNKTSLFRRAQYTTRFLRFVGYVSCSERNT